MALSFTEPAVTAAEADAYAASRAWTDWNGPSEAKAAALRRGQDYIAGLYNGRWNAVFEDATAPDMVKFAIVEAARREMAKPGSLAPDYVASAVVTRRREKVEGIERELEFRNGTDAASTRPTIALIEQMLAGLTSAAKNTTAVSVLARA